jgi:hypothetical protein
MKIVIYIQDLESRGSRWKYAGGDTYVIRDICHNQLNIYDNVYFKEFLENRFNSSYTGKPPTHDYEMQSYIRSITFMPDHEEETDPWQVPYELIIRDIKVDGKLSKELFCYRFYPKQDYWSTDEQYADVIGYVEQCYITPTNHSKDYRREYVKKDTSHIVLDDFIHRDFSRKAYDMYADMEVS